MRDFITAEDRIFIESPLISSDMKAFIIGLVYFIGLLFIASEPMRNM